MPKMPAALELRTGPSISPMPLVWLHLAMQIQLTNFPVYLSSTLPIPLYLHTCSLDFLCEFCARNSRHPCNLFLCWIPQLFRQPRNWHVSLNLTPLFNSPLKEKRYTLNDCIPNEQGQFGYLACNGQYICTDQTCKSCQLTAFVDTCTNTSMDSTIYKCYPASTSSASVVEWAKVLGLGLFALLSL